MRALRAMSDDGADEARTPLLACALRQGATNSRAALVLMHRPQVVLEAETTNAGALRLYAGLGFIRDKRLARYYLSGTDAYRLKLLLPAAEERGTPTQDGEANAAVAAC